MNVSEHARSRVCVLIDTWTYVWGAFDCVFLDNGSYTNNVVSYIFRSSQSLSKDGGLSSEFTSYSVKEEVEMNGTHIWKART